MDLNKYRDKVNINLIKCIYKLRKQIMDVYQIKQTVSEDNHVDNPEDIKFVAIKSEEGYENLEFLSSSLTKLSDKLKSLKVIYTTTPEDTFNQDVLSEYDIDLKNEVNINLVTSYLESQVDNLIRYASCVLQIYKVDETSDNRSAVKKCLTSLNKEIKNVLFTVYDKNVKPECITDLNELCEKILVLSRKVSKITSKYVHKFYNGDIQENIKSEVNNETDSKFIEQNEDTPRKKKKKVDKDNKSLTPPNLSNCETASNSDIQDYVVKKGDLSITSNENLSESICLTESDTSITKKSKKRKNEKTDEVENDFKTPKKKSKRNKTSDCDESNSSINGDTPKKKNKIDKTPERSNVDSPRKKKSKDTCLDCENKSCEIHSGLYKTEVEFVNITLENVDANNIRKEDSENNQISSTKKINVKEENLDGNNHKDKTNGHEKNVKNNKTSNKKLERNNKENLNDTKKNLKQINLLDSFIQKYKTDMKTSTEENKINKTLNSESKNSTCVDEIDLSDEDHDLSDSDYKLSDDEDKKPKKYNLSVDDDKFTQVQILLEEAEEHELDDDVKSQLESLYIQPTWEVPESHQIETRLCIGPTKEQKQELLKHNIICGPPFTKVEDKSIIKNFEKFCKEYDFKLDATPFLTWQKGTVPIMSHTERIKFVQYIGKDLPHRMLSSIYRRFKILYSPVKKGRFTKQEDEIILTYAKNAKGAKKNEPKFAPLVKVLNRSRSSLQTRYKCLLEEKTEKIRWTVEMDTKLLRSLMKVLNIDDYTKLRDKQIDHSVFQEVGAEMDLPLMKVKIHWLKKLYTQLFAPEPIRYDRLKVKLMEKLIELKENDWRGVNWQNVATHFDGCSNYFLMFIAKVAVRHNVPPAIQNDLKKCLKHFKEKFDSGIPITGKKGYLSRYRFTNNELIPCK